MHRAAHHRQACTNRSTPGCVQTAPARDENERLSHLRQGEIASAMGSNC
jgi:hypothetical protein